MEMFSETCEAHPELLAYHYAAANQKRQAFMYSQKAGMMALQRSANLEAIAHARQALTWLDAIEDDKEQGRIELALNSIMMPALMASETNGYASSALGTTAQRSLEIVESLGEDPHVFPTLWALSAYHHVRSNRPKARRLARRHLDLADRTQNVDQLAVALPVLALCLLAEGNFVEAKALLDRAEKLFTDTQHQEQVLAFGMDFFSYNCMAFSQVSWAMGYPDKALEQAQLGVTHARTLNHANTLGLALLYLMMNYQQRRDPDKVIEVSRDLDAVCEKYGLPFNQSLGALIRNWALGETEASYRILAANQANKMLLGMTYYRSLVAETEATKGNYAQTITLIDECLRDVEETGERYFLSPLHCLKGAFLLQQDREAKEVAEDCFQRAIEVAQSQKAKMHLLSATLRLCRVWQSRNQLADARAMVTKIYDEFSEGFTSPLLIEAQGFLRQLGQ
jgi:tetratricopeptide (TPR) repeat protein